MKRRQNAICLGRRPFFIFFLAVVLLGNFHAPKVLAQTNSRPPMAAFLNNVMPETASVTSTNWNNYPDPSNPVNVTNYMQTPATFYRLISIP